MEGGQDLRGGEPMENLNADPQALNSKEQGRRERKMKRAKRSRSSSMAEQSDTQEESAQSALEAPERLRNQLQRGVADQLLTFLPPDQKIRYRDAIASGITAMQQQAERKITKIQREKEDKENKFLKKMNDQIFLEKMKTIAQEISDRHQEMKRLQEIYSQVADNVTLAERSEQA